MLLQTPASVGHLDLLGLIRRGVELCEIDPAIESTWLFHNVISSHLARDILLLGEQFFIIE